MKKFLLSTLAILCCATAHAELVFYKLNFTVTRTGNGGTVNLKRVGWAIIDTDFSQIMLIKGYPIGRSFNVEASFDPQSSNVRSKNGKHISSVQIHEGISRGMTMKGTDVVKNISGVPSRLVIGGLDGWETEDGTAYLDEYKGAMVLDAAKTKSANARGIDLDQATEEAVVYFSNLNYSESETF